MPAKQNFVQGHEYDLGDGTTGVWGGSKKGWMSARDYVAMKGQGQTEFDDAKAMSERLDHANSMTAPWDATGTVARIESGEGAPGWFPFKGIGGTAGYDLNKELTPVRSNAMIKKLMEMRQNSPTGGALGNVTEGEGEKLASTDAILDVGQSQDQLKREIALMKEAMARHLPGLSTTNPAELTEDGGATIPQGAYFKGGDGKVYLNRKGGATGTAKAPFDGRTDEGYTRVPSGSYYVGPDGNLRKKR